MQAVQDSAPTTKVGWCHLEQQSSDGHSQAHSHTHDSARELSLRSGTSESGDVGGLDTSRGGGGRARGREGVRRYWRNGHGCGAGAGCKDMGSGGRSRRGGWAGPHSVRCRGWCAGRDRDRQRHGCGDRGLRNGHDRGGEAVRAAVRINGPDPWCRGCARVDCQCCGRGVGASHKGGVVPVRVVRGPDCGGHGWAVRLARRRDRGHGRARRSPVEPWLVNCAGAACLGWIDGLGCRAPVSSGGGANG